MYKENRKNLRTQKKWPHRDSKSNHVINVQHVYTHITLITKNNTPV